jgi:hypothetical protein
MTISNHTEKIIIFILGTEDSVLNRVSLRPGTVYENISWRGGITVIGWA